MIVNRMISDWARSTSALMIPFWWSFSTRLDLAFSIDTHCTCYYLLALIFLHSFLHWIFFFSVGQLPKSTAGQSSCWQLNGTSLSTSPSAWPVSFFVSFPFIFQPARYFRPSLDATARPTNPVTQLLNQDEVFIHSVLIFSAFFFPI